MPPNGIRARGRLRQNESVPFLSSTNTTTEIKGHTNASAQKTAAEAARAKAAAKAAPQALAHADQAKKAHKSGSKASRCEEESQILADDVLSSLEPVCMYASVEEWERRPVQVTWTSTSPSR